MLRSTLRPGSPAWFGLTPGSAVRSGPATSTNLTICENATASTPTRSGGPRQTQGPSGAGVQMGEQPRTGETPS